MDKTHNQTVTHRLLKGKTPEEIADFQAAYKRARRVLKELNTYATRQIDNTQGRIDSPETFNSPSWQYLVAWYGGYRTAMGIVQDWTRTT